MAEPPDKSAPPPADAAPGEAPEETPEETPGEPAGALVFEPAPEPESGDPPPAGAGPRPKPSGPRVGFWFALLLLFVPVFYPLLYFRPFSWSARIGWGLWLGFVVMVKVLGLSEPVINLTEITTELQRQERQEAESPAPAPPKEPGVMDTFVQKDDAPEVPALDDYLRELGGGLMGRRIASYTVDGTEGDPDAAIRIAFDPEDRYLDSEDAVAAEGLGMGLSLCYGRGFRAATLDFVLGGRPVRVQVTREALAGFLGMDPAAVRQALDSRDGQEALRKRSQDLLGDFFRRFAAYR